MSQPFFILHVWKMVPKWWWYHFASLWQMLFFIPSMSHVISIKMHIFIFGNVKCKIYKYLWTLIQFIFDRLPSAFPHYTPRPEWLDAPSAMSRPKSGLLKDVGDNYEPWETLQWKISNIISFRTWEITYWLLFNETCLDDSSLFIILEIRMVSVYNTNIQYQ